MGKDDVLKDVKTNWQNFYQKFFRKYCNFSEILIPEKPINGNWTLLIIADIALEQLYETCKEQFRYRRQMEKELVFGRIDNDRDAKEGVYAIWTDDGNDVSEVILSGKRNSYETLPERLIHELKLFDETGNRLDLDVNRHTLCAGSQIFMGYRHMMPYVDFKGVGTLSLPYPFPLDNFIVRKTTLLNRVHRRRRD